MQSITAKTGKLASLLRFYRHRSGGLLFAALLCAGIVPPLLCMTLIMLLTGSLLPGAVPALFSGLGTVLAFLFLVVAALSAKEEKLSFKALLERGKSLLIPNGAFALCVMLLFALAKLFLSPLFEALRDWSPFAALPVSLLLYAAESLLVAFFLGRALMGSKHLPKKQWVLMAALIFAAGYILPDFFSEATGLFSWLGISLAARVVPLILCALLQWLFLQPALLLFVPEAAAAPAEEAGAESRRTKPVAAIVSLALLGVLCVIIWIPGFASRVSVASQIGGLITEGDDHLARGDLLTASYVYKAAIAERDAWHTALTGKGSAWNSARDLPQTETVRLLYIDEYGTQETALYPLLLTQACPDEFYIYYLDWADHKLAEQPNYYEDHPEYAGRRRTILLYCVYNGIWTGNSVLPASIFEEQKEALAAELEAFDAPLIDRQGVLLYNEYVTNGGVLTQKMADSAVKIAREHPNSLFLQGMAMEVASTYSEDGGDHYEGGAEAALRYDELYMAQNKKASAAQIVAHKSTVAVALMSCRKLEEAKTLLAGTIEKYESDSLKLLYAGCLYRLSEYEECAKEAKALADAGSEEALGLLMLTKAMLEEPSEALIHALALSELAQAGDPAVGDAMLFTYAQGLADVYISNKQFTYQNCYDRLSEEDAARMQTDPLLNSLAEAVWHWQKKNYDEALAAADKALEHGANWAYLHYLRGAILFEQLDYEAALQSFTSSAEINRGNPAVWFMVGHCYDRLKLYEESVSAFTVTLELMPNSDHWLDYYGLALHADYAVRDLQNYVGRTGEEDAP